MEKFFNINKRGCSIRCKMYYADIKSVTRVVICIHGFAGHKDNKAAARFSEFVLKKHRDIAVISYDAPCHGDDAKKKLVLDDCALYTDIVAEYARKRFDTDELYIYANSFGAYQILKYISERGNPFRKIALRCPAVNMYEILMRIMSPEEIRTLEKNKPILGGFDRKVKMTRQFVEDLKKNDITSRDFGSFADDLKIIQGTKDEVVSYDLVEDFARKNSIRFVSVENADHRFKDPKKMDAAIKETVDFFGF